MSGPKDGPTNGAAVKTIIGACMLWRLNKSPTVPPDTERKALPEKPSKNRAMSMVSIFFETVEGMIHIKNIPKDARYIGRRP
jgi:hypothetical protein